MKSLQKVILFIALFFIIGHNVLEHAAHDEHLFAEQTEQEGFLGLLKDIFAFGGGDENLDNLTKRKCDKCIGLIFIAVVITTFGKTLIIPQSHHFSPDYLSHIYQSLVLPSNYIKRAHKLRGSPC